MKKLTPILYVDAIEPCLPFGATEIFVREPGGHVLGFAQME